MEHKSWRRDVVSVSALVLLSLLGWAVVAGAAETPAAGPNLEGGRIGFTGDSLGVTVGTTDIASDHVYDYTFSSAPTDWLARSGLWNATNRWTCSPQWSWYGGFSPQGVAAMWNKRYFEGDITVEAHVAFKMRVGRDPVYLHPNDINISICGDGANLDSGYSFIIGGDDNRYTRIMRGNRVIAENRDLASLWPIYENGQPSTYEWHRKWWSLRVRKVGTKLSAYMDERLIVEGTDPQPLPGGRVAVWVLRNDMITPRIKVYAEKEKLPRPPLPDDNFVLAPQTVAAPAQVRLTSASHPSVQNNFENDLGRWAVRDADQGATLTLTPGGAEGKGHCLKLVNRAAGGNFGATVLGERFDVRQLPELSFDYKLSPDVKVNFYLSNGDKALEVGFTGPKTPAPGCYRVGAFEGIKADDAWHHASFDLLGALQTFLGSTADLTCSDLWVGNLSNENYLLAGFGGNHWAATWYVDNFSLGRPAGNKLQLAITPVSGVEVAGYSLAVDSNPLGEAPAAENLKTTDYAAELAADKVSYVHVRPLLKDGKWGNTVTQAVGCDVSAPKVVATEPTADTAISEGDVTLRFADPGGSGLDLASLKLNVAGKDLALGSAGLSYDPAMESVSVNLRDAGVVLPAEGKLAVTLAALKDRAGNAVAGTPQWSFVSDLKNDKQPPSMPLVKFSDAYLCDDNFEQGMGEWIPYGGGEGAVLSRDTSTAYTGRSSLKLHCRALATRFGAYAVQRPFDAGKYRIVRFAYKCDDRLRTDLAVYVNGDWKGIRFTDNDNDLGVIGAVPDVKTDGEWHVASFNLYNMLRADDPHANTFIVRQFIFADWGWRGNRIGATYHLDDFQIVPIVSGAAPLTATWSAADASGLEGVAYALADNNAAPAPSQLAGAANDLSLDLKALTDAWLGLRVKDKAGNWSPVAWREVLVDSAAPAAQGIEPVASAPAATSIIRLQLTDQGLAGIDPTSVRLKVADAEYTVDGQGLQYEPTNGELIWNCEKISPSPVVFPNGKQVAVALASAADYAGNKAPSLPQWTWTMDYTKDKAGPVPAEIQSTSHPTLMTSTFEDGLGSWKNRDGANGALVEVDTTDKASGQACVKLTQQKAGGHMQATIWDQPYPAERYPLLAFDYKVPADTKLVLNFLVANNWYSVMLNDAAPGVIGSVPGFIADNTWRHATLDLVPILRRQIREGALVVDQVVVGDRDPLTTPQGAVARFDNFVIGQIGRYAPVLRWRTTDTTGIQGYSYVLDKEAGTVPDTTSEGAEPAKSFDALQAGIWYFHLRAQDGAGNWGAPVTYALLHLQS